MKLRPKWGAEEFSLFGMVVPWSERSGGDVVFDAAEHHLRKSKVQISGWSCCLVRKVRWCCLHMIGMLSSEGLEHCGRCTCTVAE